LDVKNQFDTIRILRLSNYIYQNKFIIIDLKNPETYCRRVLFIDNKVSTDTICNLLQEDFNGFSINWIKENKNGFEISVEYGSRIYYHKIFYFDYIKSRFILKRILVTKFDKFQPQKVVKKSILPKNMLPIDKFHLVDYLTY